jgi:transcriptional regulator with XRE-family HTH domain
MKNKEYRHGLVNAQIEIDLPLQIRALRRQLIGTQAEMAKLTGMRQPRLSAMEKPNGANFNLETLRRLAEAFDVALIVRFAPFSELLDWSGRFNPDNFRVPSFNTEHQADEAREQTKTGTQYSARMSPDALATRRKKATPTTAEVKDLIVELNRVLTRVLQERGLLGKPRPVPQQQTKLESTDTPNPSIKPASRARQPWRGKWTILGNPQPQQLRQAI